MPNYKSSTALEPTIWYLISQNMHITDVCHEYSQCESEKLRVHVSTILNNADKMGMILQCK